MAKVTGKQGNQGQEAGSQEAGSGLVIVHMTTLLYPLNGTAYGDVWTPRWSAISLNV